MNSLKPHIAPTLHNAIGGLITAAVLALVGGVVWFVSALRDLSVPLWLALLLVAAWTALLIVRSAKKNQQHSTAIAALLKEHESAIAHLEQRHSDAASRQKMEASKLEQQYHALATELIEMVKHLLEDDKPTPPSRLQELNDKLTRLLEI